MLTREEIVRGHAGKIHETLQSSATVRRLDPITASEVDQSKARGREVDKRGACRAAQEEMGEFRETWIVANHQQSFYGNGYSLQNVSEGFDIAVVEQILDVAGWFLREFPRHDVQRFARAPGRRNNCEIWTKTGSAAIDAHSRGIGTASFRQWSFKIALLSAGRSFRVANEEKPWHRAQVVSREHRNMQSFILHNFARQSYYALSRRSKTFDGFRAASARRSLFSAAVWLAVSVAFKCYSPT